MAKGSISKSRMKTVGNNVYDVHCQQKLATPHTQDRWQQS